MYQYTDFDKNFIKLAIQASVNFKVSGTAEGVRRAAQRFLSQQDSLTVAVAKTFDGEHPCQLCHTVKEGRQEEQKKQARTTIAKLDAVLAPAIQIPLRPEAPHVFLSVAQWLREVSLSPLTPPPRAA